MASRGNRHCVSCIGVLSFPTASCRTCVRHVVVDGVAGVAFAERDTLSMTLHGFLNHILQRLILHSTDTHFCCCFPLALNHRREPSDTVKARKLAYYGHTTRKQGSCLEIETMQRAMPGAHRRGRPRMAWMDNIKTWTGLPVEESIRMKEDRDKWRKYVHGVANQRIKDG